MKLGKWLKYLDPIMDVAIFTDKSPADTPAFEGSLLDLPKKYKKMKIGRPADAPSGEEPIFVTQYVNTHGVTVDHITINLLEK